MRRTNRGISATHTAAEPGGHTVSASFFNEGERLSAEGSRAWDVVEPGSEAAREGVGPVEARPSRRLLWAALVAAAALAAWLAFALTR
jgi:predicted small integral membrane protein